MEKQLIAILEKLRDIDHKMLVGLERLEGMSPATSLPASCSETSEARTDQDAHNKLTPPLRHSETEEGVKLHRMLEEVYSLAARERRAEKGPAVKGWLNYDQHHAKCAAIYDQIATMLSAIISETPDESEAGGVEECRCHAAHRTRNDAEMLDHCPVCGGLTARGKRRKRSESRNDQGMAAPSKTADNQ